MNFKNINNLNILFSTHSPFILSDIPSQSILKLKKGKTIPYDKQTQTFGANIHELLANEFFLSNGFMGQHAKKKIEEAILFLNFNLLLTNNKKLIIDLKNDP